MLSFFSYTYMEQNVFICCTDIEEQNSGRSSLACDTSILPSLLLTFPSFLVSKLTLLYTIIILTHSVISLGFSNAAQYVLEPLQFEVRLVNRT